MQMKNRWLRVALLATVLLSVLALAGCLEVDIDPDSLNLMEKTKGKAVITAYLDWTFPFDPEEIETVEVSCPCGGDGVMAHAIKTEWVPIDPMNPCSPMKQQMVVKFDRIAVAAMIKANCNVDPVFEQWVDLKVTVNGTESDMYTLRVLMPDLASEK